MKPLAPAPTSDVSPIQAEIDAARDRARQPLDREEIAEIVSAVLETAEGDVSAAHVSLYNEIGKLARFLRDAQREISDIRPDDINVKHLPKAQDELDAIVGATEAATGEILDACEAIETVAADFPGDGGDRLTDAVTRIYEACNFQDVTGQRVTKVVKTLKEIENKVIRLLAAFGDEVAKAREHVGEEAEEAEDLLAGPQLPSDAMSQDDIDKLLASFD